jgi:hypothetical protein
MPFGGATQPGQLNAQALPLLQQMMQFYSGQPGGQNIPGASTLSQIANQGVSALPAWQAMVGAQQRNIGQGLANLREQYGSMGNLAGSPFAQAGTDYMTQAIANQNAQLGQMQLQGILQGQLPAAEQLMGGAMGFGQYGQGLQQQAIQNVQNEFMRTRPEYSPTLPLLFGGATSFNPMMARPTGTGGGLLNSLLASLPGAAGAGISAGMSGGGWQGLAAALGGLA